jgi:hypothetical protein
MGQGVPRLGNRRAVSPLTATSLKARSQAYNRLEFASMSTERGNKGLHERSLRGFDPWPSDHLIRQFGRPECQRLTLFPAASPRHPRLEAVGLPNGHDGRRSVTSQTSVQTWIQTRCKQRARPAQQRSGWIAEFEQNAIGASRVEAKEGVETTRLRKIEWPAIAPVRSSSISMFSERSALT